MGKMKPLKGYEKTWGAGDPNYIDKMVKMGKKNKSARSQDNSNITRDYRLEQGVGPLQEVPAKPMYKDIMPNRKVSKKDLKAFEKAVTKKRK